MEKITAFIDGSAYATSVCDYAVWAGQRLGQPIAIVHVLGRRNEVSSTLSDLSGSLNLGARSELLDKLAGLDEQRAKLGRERGRALLDAAAERVRASAAVEVTTRLRNGDLIEAVRDLEAETRFTIIGKRGEAADFARMHLGSNLDRAVRTSEKPILVASRAYRPVERFLLAFDGSPSAERALKRLEAGSVLDGLECHMVMAGVLNDAAMGALQRAAERVRAAGYEVITHTKPGDPESAIARCVADNAIDLLVLGKSGQSRIRQLFIGSTTLSLMRSCQIPVLIFP